MIKNAAPQAAAAAGDRAVEARRRHGEDVVSYRELV